MKECWINVYQLADGSYYLPASGGYETRESAVQAAVVGIYPIGRLVGRLHVKLKEQPCAESNSPLVKHTGDIIYRLEGERNPARIGKYDEGRRGFFTRIG